MKFLVKIFKFAVSLFLLPFSIGSMVALWQIVVLSGKAGAIWSFLFMGVIIWVLIYLFLPEPKWLYVFGHESTHALWSLIFGGKLKKFKVRSNGGHVSITKSNFLITLAPYFFPFYAILIFLIYAILSIFFDVSKYTSIFYVLVGLAYSFHVTLTYKILKIRQPDVTKEGYFFSFIIIILGNMLILLIGIPLLTEKSSVHTALSLWVDYSSQIFHYIFNLF